MTRASGRTYEGIELDASIIECSGMSVDVAIAESRADTERAEPRAGGRRRFTAAVTAAR